MTDTRTELAVGWAILAQPSDQEFNAYDLTSLVGSTPCRIAVDRDGVRHLLVPLSSFNPLAPSPQQNLHVAIRRLQFDGAQPSATLDLSCRDTALSREFDEVVVDVLDEISNASDPQSAAMASIDRWRRLFRASTGAKLSPEARLGLFAELSVLRAAVESIGDDALAYWTGPFRNTHDFELPGACLEVKGLGADAESITIHGIDQMAPHEGRPLDLVLIEVLSDERGSTLDDLARALRDSLRGSKELDDLLAMTGWAEGIYPDRYEVGPARSVLVNELVPALTPQKLGLGALDPGVTNVRYAIERAKLIPFGRPTSLRELIDGRPR